MRTLPIFAAALIAAGGGAYAQSLSPNQSSQDAARRAAGINTPQTGGSNNSVAGRGADTNASEQPRTNLPDWTLQPEARAPTGEQSPTVSAAVPSHWSGDAASWERHREACAARYQTYDPATDEFYAQPGVRERCRL